VNRAANRSSPRTLPLAQRARGAYLGKDDRGGGQPFLIYFTQTHFAEAILYKKLTIFGHSIGKNFYKTYIFWKGK
jgi:hypothetical protein